MFRKKKAIGQVTVIEEDDIKNSLPQPTRHIPSSAATRSNNGGIEARPTPDFEFDSRHTKEPTAEELDDMTEEQMQQLIQDSADAGKESTGRALRMVTEARDIGVNTATQMQQQTAQLEKMTEDIEEVHDYLDKSEKTIERMTKNRLVRMFQVKKPKGKGLDHHKGTKKEQDAQEELRAKGLDAIDVKGMQKKQGTLSMSEFEREQLLGDATDEGGKRRRLFGKKKEQVVRVDTKDIKEDYSQYSEPVASKLREQDEDLDQISEIVGDLKALSTAMNNELEYQNEKIEQVQNFTDETSKRTKLNARKIAKIK